MSDNKCEDRIDAALDGRVGDLEIIMEALENETPVLGYDDPLEAMGEFALALDIKSTLIVTIGTGGPGDQFEIEIVMGPHGWELNNSHATYRFLDWFDGATRLTDNDAVMEYLRSMAERLSC